MHLWLLALLVCLCFDLPASAGAANTEQSPPTWKQVQVHGLENETLLAVWGSGRRDVWAVGLRYVMHFDGTEWRLAFKAPIPLHVIGGSGPSDVWMAGHGVLHWDGAAARVVEFPLAKKEAHFFSWFSGIQHAGGTTLIAHSEGVVGIPSGRSFRRLPVAPRKRHPLYMSMWAAGENDIWMGEPDGIIAHWNGKQWKRASGGEISAIWGAGPQDVWAVGGAEEPMPHSQVKHWDGRQWSDFMIDTKDPLRAVWGSGADDVWVSGGVRDDHANIVSGTLAHWNGTTWEVTRDLQACDINGIWGTGARDVWAVGDHGLIMHYGVE